MSSAAPARGRPRRSTSSSRDPYYPGPKRHSDEHDELSDSGSDGGYSDDERRSHRPHSPNDARPRRTRTLMTSQQLTILHGLLQQTRFPTTAQREDTARQTGLTPRKVQVWFQNQRQKQNDAARKANATNLPLYSANSGSQWRAATAAEYQNANSNAAAQYQAAGHNNAAFAVRTPMDPIRPSTPDAYIPMGVGNNGSPVQSRRRYDSVTYDSRGGVAPPAARANPPLYGMAPVPMAMTSSPASAESYRLRSLHSPPSPQTSRSQPRYAQEDLRLPPLNLENDRGRSSHSSSRPPTSGSRPSHLRTSSTVGNIPPPFTLEPQPMWSSPGPPVPTAATNNSSSAARDRARSGSDPIRGFDGLDLGSASAHSSSRHHHSQSTSNAAPRQPDDRHLRRSSAQAQPLARGVASAVPSPLAHQQQFAPPRASTPGPYGYDSRPPTAGVKSPPMADPIGRSATPSPSIAKKFWPFGSRK